MPATAWFKRVPFGVTVWIVGVDGSVWAAERGWLAGWAVGQFCWEGWPAGEQFGRAPANPVGVFATAEPLVVEEESQQVQEIAAELTAEEEIGPQAAVDVLDEGTGSRRMVQGVADFGLGA